MMAIRTNGLYTGDMKLSCILLQLLVLGICAFGDCITTQGKRSTQRESSTFGKALSGKEIYSKYSKSVVTLKTKTANGTGFFDSEGRLFTCWHVVKDASEVEVQFSDGKKVMAYWVQHVNVDADIAVLVTSFYKEWGSGSV